MSSAIREVADNIGRAVGVDLEVNATPIAATFEASFVKEYAAAAAVLGYRPLKFEVEQFKSFCAERGIPA
jgi:hypothetical protein